ncbi:MAG: HAD hydrolase-like protein [Methanomassiliicoccus sp.]|nr:HAD hydrolase-like protein [Methanomassiliicoccus sp.]
MRAPMLYGREVRGVVLDLDGTLVNTTVDFIIMKKRVTAELVDRGIPTSLLDPKRTTADHIERAADYLEAKGRGEEVGNLHRSLREIMNNTEMEHVSATTAVPGAGECLGRLREGGLKLGVLTRGSRGYALAALRHAGLDMHSEAIVCRDDFPEEEAKPNGKAMVRTAGLMSLRPAECILVGDHAMDLACARSVSASFVGVLSGSFRAEDWARSGCEVVIDSVASLPGLLFDGKA